MAVVGSVVEYVLPLSYVMAVVGSVVEYVLPLSCAMAVVVFQIFFRL